MQDQVHICIYCKEVVPTNEISDSHIIPASLGGFRKLRFAVCSDCNLAISLEVENPFKEAWAWLPSVLDVRGRRGKPPAFKAEMRLLGKKVDVTVRSRSRPPDIPPIIIKGIGVHLIGARANVDRMMKEFDKKHPRVWTEQAIETPGIKEVLFPINVDSLDAPLSWRLAAKVAFESWAKLRNPKAVLDSEFDSVREFIRYGKISRGCWSGLITDENIIMRNLRIEFPNHAVSFVAHPSESILGSIVVLFGLFYYAVMLSKHYPLIVSLSELIIDTPLGRKSKQGLLTGSLKLPRIPWERILKSDVSRADKAWSLARNKLKESGFTTT